jgi:hypothetical protein
VPGPQAIRVALASFSDLRDLLSDGFDEGVLPVRQLKRDQRTLVSAIEITGSGSNTRSLKMR